MARINKVLAIDEALRPIASGTRLMVGEFVGAGEPLKCVEWLIEQRIDGLTLIANTAGMRGGFSKAQLFQRGQIAELIGSHVGTTDESTHAYLSGNLKVAEFFPMGTWAEKVRAGAVGLGGILVPVGVGILDQDALFPGLGRVKQTMQLGAVTYLVEPALTADVSLIKGWRADTLGNVEFRGTSGQNQRDLAMAGRYTVAEVNEIVQPGIIDPERVGCPGVFVDAVVQGYSLEQQHDRYRRHWVELGRLAPA